MVRVIFPTGIIVEYPTGKTWTTLSPSGTARIINESGNTIAEIHGPATIDFGRGQLTDSNNATLEVRIERIIKEVKHIGSLDWRQASALKNLKRVMDTYSIRRCKFDLKGPSNIS